MAEVANIWEQTKAVLQEKLGQSAFETWILPLKVKTAEKEKLCLEAPDTFFKDWVERHYKELIRVALISLPGGQNIPFYLEAASSVGNPIETPAVPPHQKRAEAAKISSLNDRYTFENFVVGPSNKHAHAYSLAVAEAPGKTYNPLFIYGGVGLGKTHLIQAVCHHISKNAQNNLNICYISSERFTNELIDAIQRRSTSGFRQKYRNMDVLVIDDVHFIAGKESTQEEFFHTFNALYDAHKQIVLSSDRPPKEIENLQDRLISRFGWGLTTDIQPPDFETRVAILKKKIEREPVFIPDEVIIFIAQLIKTNIRELEGALIRTIAYSLLEEKPITMELTREVLKDLLREPKKLITVDFIQHCVAEEFGISLQEIKTKRRNKTIVLPRQAAMYLSRELTDLSLLEIGTFFGGKDHTTVLHSYNKIKEKITSDLLLKEKIERVMQIVKQ